MRFRFPKAETAMFLASFAYLCIGAHIGMVYLDDGAWVFAAKRILQGDVPYRDFMTIITPAYYYLLALLFKFLGPYLIIERAVSCVFLTLLSCLVYLFVQKLTDSRAWAMIGLAISAVYLGNYSHYPGSAPAALFFGLWGVYCFFGFMNNKSPQYLFCSGLAVAASFLFRQDIGVYIFLVLASGIFWISSKNFYRYLMGFAIIVIPAAAYFLVKVPLGDLWYDFVEYPLKIYPSVARLPYPVNFSSRFGLFASQSLFDFLWQVSAMMPYILPPLIYVGFFIRVFLNPTRACAMPQRLGITLLIFLGLLFLNQARLRADDWHILATLLPAVILFVIFIRRLWSHPFHRGVARPFVCFLVLLISFKPGVTKIAILIEPNFVACGLPTAKGISFMKEAVGTENNPQEFLNYQKAIQFVVKNVPKSEPIFVSSIRHDRICSADPLFYFLADRPSATKFHEMHRGYVTQESVQRQIVRELESSKTQYIVRRQILDAICSEPNASSQPMGAHYLDRYIQQNFSLVQQYGYEFVLKRNTG